MLDKDVREQPHDWVDSVSRELAVCVNAGLEISAMQLLCQKGLVPLLEQLLKQLKFKDPSHKELINRGMNVLAKATKVESAQE